MYQVVVLVVGVVHVYTSSMHSSGIRYAYHHVAEYMGGYNKIKCEINLYFYFFFFKDHVR
jgi:hypothetical protein